MLTGTMPGEIGRGLLQGRGRTTKHLSQRLASAGSSPATMTTTVADLPAASELHSGCDGHDLAVAHGVVGPDLQGRVPGHVEEVLLAVFGLGA